MRRNLIKMNKKNLIMFIGGLIIGAAGGVFGTRTYFKKKYEEIADDEINHMRDWYEEKVSEVAEIIGDDGSDDEQEFVGEDPTVKIDPNKMSEIKEKLVRNYEQTTNYAKMYGIRKEEEAVDSDDEATDSDDEYREAEALNEERVAEHKDGKIKIISADDAGELPAYYSCSQLFFYRDNDVVTDENDIVMDDYERYIGDSLDKFGFRDSDEQTIWVKNPELDTVYEIRKFNTAFEE
jgi:hypothetical protein